MSGASLLPAPSKIHHLSEAPTGLPASDTMLPVHPQLAALLPHHGLRRGTVLSVLRGTSSGTTSLLLMLIAAATTAGHHCAILGMPRLGIAAAADLGVAVTRLGFIPNPAQPDKVIAALLTGVDIVVTAHIPAPGVRRQLTARVTGRRAILIPVGNWDNPDLSCTVAESAWFGLHRGHGLLTHRRLTVQCTGRGAASRPRRITVWPYGQPSTLQEPLRDNVIPLRAA